MNQTPLDEGVTAIVKMAMIAFLLALRIEASQIGYLLILIFLDSFFGTLRVFKLQEGFSFSKLYWGITVKLCILIIPFLIAGGALVFQIDLLYIVKLFIIIIAVNDVISILASIISMKSGKLVKSVDFIERAMRVLMDFFTEMIKNKIDQIKGGGKEE
jgi:hypothetical protein